MITFSRISVRARTDGKVSIYYRGFNDRWEPVAAGLDEIDPKDIQAVSDAVVKALIETQAPLYAVKTDSRDHLMALGLWPLKTKVVK